MADAKETHRVTLTFHIKTIPTYAKCKALRWLKPTVVHAAGKGGRYREFSSRRKLTRQRRIRPGLLLHGNGHRFCCGAAAAGGLQVDLGGALAERDIYFESAIYYRYRRAVCGDLGNRWVVHGAGQIAAGEGDLRRRTQGRDIDAQAGGGGGAQVVGDGQDHRVGAGAGVLVSWRYAG